VQSLDCWDRGFVTRWGNGSWFLVCVVQVAAASATSWSLVQRGVTKGVSLCDLDTSAVRQPSHDLRYCATENECHWNIKFAEISLLNVTYFRHR
jgi:hypothetical protein